MTPRSYFGIHICSVGTPKASLLQALSSVTTTQFRPSYCFPGRASMLRSSFWLVFLASVSLLHVLLPMATRLNFPKHASNVIIFLEKPRMVSLTLQDNLCGAFKYLMVWSQLSFPTASLSLAFPLRHPTHFYSLNTLLVFPHPHICVRLSQCSECSLLTFVPRENYSSQFKAHFKCHHLLSEPTNLPRQMYTYISTRGLLGTPC